MTDNDNLVIDRITALGRAYEPPPAADLVSGAVRLERGRRLRRRGALGVVAAALVSGAAVVGLPGAGPDTITPADGSALPECTPSNTSYLVTDTGTTFSAAALDANDFLWTAQAELRPTDETGCLLFRADLASRFVRDDDGTERFISHQGPVPREQRGAGVPLVPGAEHDASCGDYSDPARLAETDLYLDVQSGKAARQPFSAVCIDTYNDARDLGPGHWRWVSTYGDWTGSAAFTITR